MTLSVYDWKSDEFQLIDWYAQLIKSGDMYSTFTPDMRYMSNFLNFFKPPRTMGYASDKNGIFFAFWLESFLSGAFCGVWIRESHRHAPSSMKLLIESYNSAFEVYTVLMGLCKQEHLQEIHSKLGYTKRTTVPGLWNGDAVDFYTLTKADWENKHGRRKEQQQQQ